MAPVRRLVIDVLKPHDPSLLAFTGRLSGIEGVEGVTASLVELGFGVRRPYDEIPPRVEYELTPKACDLRPAFRYLYGWAATYDLEPRERTE